MNNSYHTSDHIWARIQQIRNEPSRSGKIAILQECKQENNLLFEYVLKGVFDSTISYGLVLKLEEYMPFTQNKNEGQFNASVVNFLNELSAGVYTRREAVAIFERLASHLSADSASLLVGIINKNVYAGINSSTINQVFKGLIPIFPYMRCSLPTTSDIDALPWEAGVYAQEKADGMFVNVNVGFDAVNLISRQGKPLPQSNIGEFVDMLRDVLPVGYQIHGEMLVRDSVGVLPREIGNGILNKISKGDKIPSGHDLLLKVWDCIPLSEVRAKGRYTEPYALRFKRLCDHLEIHGFAYKQNGRLNVEPIDTWIFHSKAETKAKFVELVTAGKEGLVLKNPSAIWRDGTSKEQFKAKLNCDCDLVITGFEEGEGKYRGMLGALVCETNDGLLKTNVSGFSDKVRQEVWNNQDEYNGTIVTVKFNNVMIKEDHKASLFLPRFVEFRTDKEEADTLERVIESKNKALSLDGF